VKKGKTMETVQYTPAAWRELAEWNPGLIVHSREVKIQEFSDGNSAAYAEQELARVETLLKEILE